MVMLVLLFKEVFQSFSKKTLRVTLYFLPGEESLSLLKARSGSFFLNVTMCLLCLNLTKLTLTLTLDTKMYLVHLDKSQLEHLLQLFF